MDERSGAPLKSSSDISQVFRAETQPKKRRNLEPVAEKLSCNKQCVCLWVSVCVWNIWKDVKLLICLLRVFWELRFGIRYQTVTAGGTGPLWIPVPTKLFHNGGSGDWSPPCTCTNFHFRPWQPAKPSTGMSLFPTVFKPLYGFRNLNYCRLRQMEQLHLART